jgi:hypothetical protein
MDELFEVGEEVHRVREIESSVSTTVPPELQVRLSIETATALGPASVYRWKGAVRGTTIPFTTVEDNPDITPALKLPPQLFVAVQTATGDYEDEHFLSPTIFGGHVFPRVDSPITFGASPSRRGPQFRSRHRCSRRNPVIGTR